MAANETDGVDLVQQLSSAPKPAPAKIVADKKIAAVELPADILGDLAKSSDRVAQKPKSAPALKPDANVDRNVLDGLMGNDQNSGGGKAH